MEPTNKNHFRFSSNVASTSGRFVDGGSNPKRRSFLIGAGRSFQLHVQLCAALTAGLPPFFWFPRWEPRCSSRNTTSQFSCLAGFWLGIPPPLADPSLCRAPQAFANPCHQKGSKGSHENRMLAQVVQFDQSPSCV